MTTRPGPVPGWPPSGGRSWLRKSDDPELADHPERLAGATASLSRVTRRLGRLSDHLPAAVRSERQAQVTSFLLRALADRAASIDRGNRPRLSHEAFAANLVDVLVAVLAAPSSRLPDGT